MKLVLLGSGGHARVVRAAAEAAGLRFAAVCERDGATPGAAADGLAVVAESELEAAFPAESTQLVNGVAGANSTALRRLVSERWQGRGYRFVGVVDPRAIVVSGAVVDSAAQVLAGAIVQVGAEVAAGAIINSGAVVEHDCRVGEFAHIAPGAILCGGVDVQPGALVGAGATVAPGRTIGCEARVGAGAVVVNHVEAGQTVTGVPARIK